ncbi:MAG: phage/plasmid primase, P4 family [Hespellia sp.]|nr:phage/plasmid primase, P4 family [Hespellia sp.]
MQLTIFNAACVGNAKNCTYPQKCVVTSAEELIDAVKFDHVCAEYQKNYRNVSNFIQSDVVVMDLDNDHSDNPADWVMADMLDEMMPDISYALAPSRHHMLAKDGQTPRPKYHAYFPISVCTNAEDYAALKRAIHKAFPVFDGNALDAARFIYGADCTEIVWHEGWVNIDEEVEIADEEEDTSTGGVIQAGTRNNTLSRFAGRVVKRYGATDKAHEIFLEEAEKCDPPLSDEELKTIWYSAVKFAKKIQGQDGYVPPDDYNDDFGGEDKSLKPSDYSDIGQAKVLTREYGDELLFTNATDYLRFDGEVWIENKQLAVGAMEEFLDLQLQDATDEIERAKKLLVAKGVPEEVVKGGAKKIEKEVTGDQLPAFYMLLAAQQYFAFVMKRRDMKYVTSALNAAKPMLSADVNDLDKNENLLNTPYATYNLTLGIAGEQPHDPRDLITKITECSPSQDGMQIWEDALQLFFCGDADLINYVQMVVGMAAIGKVYQEHLIIAYGGGANGKSTFWNTISRVLGTYSGKLSAETLTVGCKRNVKPEMAELKGKRLIIASEMEEGMRLNTAVVKQLCSTDEVFAEKKYKDPFKFIPSHTLVLYTNHLPRVSANDDGTWRRLIVIPFNAHITGSSDIKNYTDYLFENAGGAILTWIIEGAKKAIDAGFKTPLPKCVSDAIQAYREDNDWLGHFIAECCETDPTYTEKSGEIYQQYRAYCIQNGEYTRSTTDFYSAMEKAGYERKKSNKGVIVRGLQLKAGSDFLD